MAGPTNADLQRQINLIREDNHNEHQELKKKLDEITPLIIANTTILRGSNGEGSLIEQVKELAADLNHTKLGSALGLLMLLAGIIAAKVEGWI